MKITFYSNFFSDHQLPFCREIYKLIGDDFKFIETEPMWQERIELGFVDKSKNYPYIMKDYENEQNKQISYQLSLDSDIVIVGSAPDLYLRDRVLRGKITFRYSEHFFKRGRWRILDPRVLKAHYLANFRYRSYKNLYMLCASAYTALDCKFIHSYSERTFKWGYFTEVKEHNISHLMANKEQEIIKLLWVGRLIRYKHPDYAIEIANKLRKDGYKIKLDIIGTGELETKLKQMVTDYNLKEYVKFLGPMSPEKVIENMEKSNVFLFTSDREEGWGAILNESMSSGCAVVANTSTGSVPFLIQNDKNGLVYSNNINDLYYQVIKLVEDRDLCKKLGENACATMSNIWNPKIAAERFIVFCEGLLNGEINEYKNGPLSRA